MENKNLAYLFACRPVGWFTAATYRWVKRDREYNFRPGVMKSFSNQKNWKPVVKFLVRIFQLISPKSVLTLQEVGRAMIHAVTIGYPKNVLEVSDIGSLHRNKKLLESLMSVMNTISNSFKFPKIGNHLNVIETRGETGIGNKNLTFLLVTTPNIPERKPK